MSSREFPGGKTDKREVAKSLQGMEGRTLVKINIMIEELKFAYFYGIPYL